MKQRRKHSAAGRPARVAWPTHREPPINAVTYDRPKLLTGLNQNGVWLDHPLQRWDYTDSKATGEQAEPNLPIAPDRAQMRNAKRGKPVFFPNGKANRKERRRECGQGQRQKRTPYCNDMDRDFNVIPRESGQNGAWVSHLQENL